MTETTPAPKPSKQEGMKEDSKFLRGSLSEELDDRSSEEVSDAAYELLKFHGSYFGYDRDSATERKKAGLEKEFEFMVRVRAPGGTITAQQYLAMEDVAREYANNTLRITTRQVFQFHVIKKAGMKPLVKAIIDSGLSTLAGCGDVVRNITGMALPVKDAKHARLIEDIAKVAELCKPKTSAYEEVWLGKAEGNREGKPEEVEPLYGAHYMPRKFKIGLCFPEDNVIDVLTHDLGVVLIFEGEELKGYNLYVGGSLGMNHNQPATYARLASPLAFIEPDDLEQAVEAIVKIQRDNGDRASRKHARLKYVVQEKGMDWMRNEFNKYFGKAFKEPVAVKFEIKDHMGWHEQKDGKWYLGVPVPSGRVSDNEQGSYHTAFNELAKTFAKDIVLTPDQNIIFCDIDSEEKASFENILKANNIKLTEAMTPLERNFFACVALPTCGKALAEAERVQLPMVEGIQAVMDKHGLRDERISVRVSGCPNNCSRPSVSEIGIIGRMPGHYVIRIGGTFEGTELNEMVFDKVPEAEIPVALDPMFAIFKAEREEGEAFGVFCRRYGIEKLAAAVKPQLADYKWAA
jgi:sulfite reductase (ferredoxin)